MFPSKLNKSRLKTKINNWIKNQYNVYKYATVISPRITGVLLSLNSCHGKNSSNLGINKGSKIEINKKNRGNLRKSNSKTKFMNKSKFRCSSGFSDCGNTPILYPSVLTTFDTMDSSFRSVIETLSENIPAGTESEIDTIQLELNQRTFEMELVTKRIQVDQLREEVDTLNQVNHDFKRDLTLANETIASLESELAILRKNVSDAESEAKNRLLVEKKFDKKILEIENSTLKGLLQKSEMEKRKLQREKEDLLAQQNIHSGAMRELLEQDQKIRGVIDKYTKAFDDVDKQKDKVVDLHKKLEEFQKSNHQMELLHEKLEGPTSKIKKLEKEQAFAEAKLDMLEELLRDYSLPQSESSSDIHTYYIEKTEELERHLKIEKELVFKQQERLNKEVSANTLLCNKLEDLEKQVEELEKKLARIDNRQSVNLCD